MRTAVVASLLASLFAAFPAQAMTFVDGPDKALVERAELVVVGRIERLEPKADQPFSTWYRLTVESVLKGDAGAREALAVRVVGGPGADGTVLHVPGAPAFAPGERGIFFLAPAERGGWGILDLARGVFRDDRGIALRDFTGTTEVRVKDGLQLVDDPADRPRDFARFAAWIADQAAGIDRAADYWAPPDAQRDKASVAAPFALFGGRWFTFESGSEPWLFHSAGFDGAGGGQDSFNTAMAAWNADPGSTINYVPGGTTGSATGFGGSPGVNVITFGDPAGDMPGTFACPGGGILGIGGYTESGNGTYLGNSYDVIIDGDIVINDGTACFLAGNLTGQAEVFAHELGHSLGLAHSGVFNALMWPAAHNDLRGATLDLDDQGAIAVLYGNGVPPPPLTPPAAPGNLLATSISSSTVMLNWSDNSSNETQFRIEVDASSDGVANFGDIGFVTSNRTTATIVGLSASTSYDFRVRARNTAGSSAYSNVATAVTQAGGGGGGGGGLTAPSNLAATALSSTAIRLTWNDNSSGEDSFRIERLQGGSFAEIGSTAANATQATVTGLAPGTSYTFRVRARNGSIFSNASNQASAATHSACGNDPDVLCLANRFAVTVAWDTTDGASGKGRPQPLTSDTGYFWFFGADNVELVTKVVNGCGVPGLASFWFFAGGLTDVHVVITVRDIVAGPTRTYSNPQGQAFKPIQDTAAFATCTPSDALAAASAPAASPAVHAAACASGADTLCLHDGRFQVEAFWSAADGSAGKGTAIALTSETGYFWFFSSANIELVTKVLDACSPPFDRFWVFATGLTDVEVRLKVTDTDSGTVREYVNPRGTAYAPVQDIAAFATCP